MSITNTINKFLDLSEFIIVGKPDWYPTDPTILYWFIASIIGKDDKKKINLLKPYFIKFFNDNNCFYSSDKESAIKKFAYEIESLL